jgi:hypothetical protein
MTTDSLASWKRQLAVGGTIRVRNFIHPVASGIRSIEKVQTKSMATRMEDDRVAWVDFPRKGEYEVDGRTLRFLTGPGGTVAFEYRILEGVED